VLLLQSLEPRLGELLSLLLDVGVEAVVLGERPSLRPSPRKPSDPVPVSARQELEQLLPGAHSLRLELLGG